MTDPASGVSYRWAIQHVTSYRYTSKVAFATHVLRLSPRPDSVHCLARQLHISPTPLQTTEYTDAFGNSCTRVNFGAGHFDALIIDSRIELETLAQADNPHTNLPPLPWLAAADDGLAPFRERDESPQVTALAQELLAQVGQEPLAFFECLCRTLYTRLDRQLRFEGAAQTPSETLDSGRGACRDLTVLFLAVCRALGVAARFVSGYQGQEQSPDGKRHLHAWPEVFVPGRGWLGHDPTHGIPTGPGHVALSAAPNQAATMPVEGGFYFDGPDITSTLEYSISMDPL